MEVVINDQLHTQVMLAGGKPLLTESEDVVFSRNSGRHFGGIGVFSLGLCIRVLGEYLSEYSSSKKLLDYNLEWSSRVNRVTPHSPKSLIKTCSHCVHSV